MANKTYTTQTIHGQNPQYLIEKITRAKIYDCAYWKEHCFALTNETIIDKAVQLTYVAGTYGGNRKPSHFLCLTLKLLQLVPEKAIIREMIENKALKYIRLLVLEYIAAFYLRLTGDAPEIYKALEPLYGDYRRVRRRLPDATFTISHVDEIIDIIGPRPTELKEEIDQRIDNEIENKE